MTETTARPALVGVVEADCIVVGAGLAGLITALELARGGLKPVVIEARAVGWGASGRNGGIVSPAFACGGDEIEARVGRDAARALHRLTIEGVDRVRGLISDLKIEGATPLPGLLNLRRFDKACDLHAYAAEFSENFGYDFGYLDRKAIRDRLVTDRYFHGLSDPHAFHIHPLNYLRGIAAELERLGGRIYEGSAATQAQWGAAEKGVKTANGEARAPQVIFATGGYTDGLVPRLKRAVLPIATYMMISEAAPDLIATAKGIAGGLPLAAVTGRAELMDSVHPGGLGGTYGGNAIGCAAALATCRCRSSACAGTRTTRLSSSEPRVTA